MGFIIHHLLFRFVVRNLFCKRSWSIIRTCSYQIFLKLNSFLLRIRSTCLTRIVPHKIYAAARTNVPLFTESKATRNPTTVVSDPSYNPHKHYCQIKTGNVKCRTLYMQYCRSDSVRPTKGLNNSTLGCHFFTSSVPSVIVSEPYKNW